MDSLERFLNFTEQSPTAFHAVENFRDMLGKAGYRELKEKDPWIVDEGGKYYVTRNDSAIIAFAIPGIGFSSFRIAAAHSDSPTFKLKPRFEEKSEKAYVRLNVEKYGGMIMSTWLDRPLSISGRRVIREGDGIETALQHDPVAAQIGKPREDDAVDLVEGFYSEGDIPAPIQIIEKVCHSVLQKSRAPAGPARIIAQIYRTCKCRAGSPGDQKNRRCV